MNDTATRPLFSYFVYLKSLQPWSTINILAYTPGFARYLQSLSLGFLLCKYGPIPYSCQDKLEFSLDLSLLPNRRSIEARQPNWTVVKTSHVKIPSNTCLFKIQPSHSQSFRRRYNLRVEFPILEDIQPHATSFPCSELAGARELRQI